MDTQTLMYKGVREGYFDEGPFQSGVHTGISGQAVEVWTPVHAFLKTRTKNGRKNFFKPGVELPINWEEDPYRFFHRMYTWGKPHMKLQNRQMGYLFVDGLAPVLLICKALTHAIKKNPDRFVTCSNVVDLYLTQFGDSMGADEWLVPASSKETIIPDPVEPSTEMLQLNVDQNLQNEFDDEPPQNTSNVHADSPATPELNTAEREANECRKRLLEVRRKFVRKLSIEADWLFQF